MLVGHFFHAPNVFQCMLGVIRSFQYLVSLAPCRRPEQISICCWNSAWALNILLHRYSLYLIYLTTKNFCLVSEINSKKIQVLELVGVLGYDTVYVDQCSTRVIVIKYSSNSSDYMKRQQVLLLFILQQVAILQIANIANIANLTTGFT